MLALHPMFRTLASQPQLLAEHAGAYAELASVELTEAAAALRHRATVAAAAVGLAVAGLALAGVALLLACAIPMAQMPAPWALLILPLAVLASAAAVWLAQRRTPVDLSFALLREQLALDRSLLAAQDR